MVMMKIPRMTRPCRNLHIASVGRLLAVAVSSVQSASTVMEPTIIRLRSTLSANMASSAADKATPSVEALMVRLTLASDAWKTVASRAEVAGCSTDR